VKLSTVIFVPKNAPAPLPILLQRTPYDIPKDEESFHSPHLAELREDGYVFAVQSLRGRFASEGEFVMLRPPRDRADPAAVDESTDAYDTIEWLVHNVPGNSGRVGIWGTSYVGWPTEMALLSPTRRSGAPRSAPRRRTRSSTTTSTTTARSGSPMPSSTWLSWSERFVDHRPDVLTWSTDVLDADVVVAGDIVADLFASTTGTDADWIVKLIDVLPDGPRADDAGSAPDLRGYELMIADEVLRARFRRSLAVPEPVPAGAVVEYTIDLHARAHAFQKGHRIMVQVQSTWFPLIDRNPQRYVENIFLARDEDYVPATQRVFPVAASTIQRGAAGRRRWGRSPITVGPRR
jgi:predicted acyl esterase